MTILTITKKGTVKLPKDVIRHLRDSKHVQVRLNAHGVTLTPVQIQAAVNLKGLP